MIPPPLNLQVIGTELAIQWSDGSETYTGLERLRKVCPCAACLGEPDVTGKVVRPDVHYGPRSFDLRSFRFIGAYAIQMVWEDGHESGLYPYRLLRALNEHGTQ